MVAGIALVEDEMTIAEYNVNYKKTHSLTLLPMLDEVKRMVELDLDSLDGIAISKGPGSFTGLRIGASTVKGLGLALNKPIIPIPTLEGLAYNLYGSQKLICPIMDARRSQVYTGIYRMEKEVETVLPQCPMDIVDLIEKLNGLGDEVVFLGDGVPVFRERIQEGLKVEYAFAPPHLNRQRAASYGSLGIEYLKRGEIVSPEDFRPDYLRESQAERERRERESCGK
nr:tRNA (adenosine(37)-N6)-threonylcarbamoyltransferase complex dimerization subunit type 1 TsaB [Aequitasia blattaphilus]